MILLPRGYSHKFHLHVIRDIRPDAGPTAGHGGNKGVTHITVTRQRHVHAAAQALINERFEPNLLAGYDLHHQAAYLYQFAPLDHASKALEHPAGTPETNRGGQIVCQLEIAAMPEDVPHFDDIGFYRVLANVWRFVNETLEAHGHHPIPWHLWAKSVARPEVERLSPEQFIRASGHGGHRDVPNQPSGHDDPTRAFKWATLIRRLHHMPHDGGYPLKGTGFHNIRKG